MPILSHRTKVATVVVSSVLTLGLITGAAAPALAEQAVLSAAVHVVEAAAKKITKVPAISISGSAKTNAKLTAKVSGSWKAGSKTVKPKLTYQWYANGKAIKGATKTTYTVAPSNVKAKISVNVTATLKGYKTTTVKSKTTGAVAAIPQKTGTISAVAATPKSKATTTTVTVSLSGFTPGAKVVVKVGSASFTVTIGSNGKASHNFTVAVSNTGKTTTYTVTGSSTVTGYTTYTPGKKSVSCKPSYVPPATTPAQN